MSNYDNDYLQQQNLANHQMNMAGGITSAKAYEVTAEDRAKRLAERARETAQGKVHAALQALLSFGGTADDLEAAANAIAKIAAKAMRRRG